MRKYLKIIFFLLYLLSSVLQATAQQEQKAFFVYRNDGDFNVMFFSEVDSIVYSQLDVDSVLCDEYVTQEIWTPDTVVRIPVAAIDSVTFQTPSTIYKDEARVIDTNTRLWIDKADSLTLYFSLQTPASIVPQVGERLVTTDMDELLPVGFIGKVRSVSRNSEYIVVDCDEINMSEVFDRYFCIVEGECVETRNGKLRLKNARNQAHIELPSLDFEEELNFAYGWEYNDYCEFGAGMSMGISVTNKPTLRYIYIKDADEFLSLNIDFEHTLSFTSSLYGGFTIEKDFDSPARFDKIIEAIPLTKIYMKSGARVEFNGSLAFEFGREDVFSSGYVYTRGTNPQINYQNRFKPLKHISGDHDVKKLIGSISLYGGLFLELGYGLLIEDWGKIYGRLDGGIEFVLEADLAKSIDDAPTSTKLYDEAGELVSFDINKAYGASAGLSSEIGNISAGVSVGAMIKENLYSAGLFPSFHDASYERGENGESYLTCGVEKNMLLPVPVGFKVFDEAGNVVFVEYYDRNYHNFSFSDYRIPYVFDKINTRYKAYPIFKLFGEYEILASPAVELMNNLAPVTENAEEVSSSDAVINGSLNGDLETTNKANYEVGFFVGTSSNPQQSGQGYVTSLSNDGKFKKQLSNLKDATTYYYCAYLKSDDKYYYGDVMSFETPKIPDDAVDLGLSVLWAKYNVGANTESQPGGLYGWADATGTVTSIDVVGNDGVTWVSPLYGGVNPPKNICGNPSYDIAANLWGNGWRLPSQAEMAELTNNCTTEYEVVEGTAGLRFTSAINGNSVFFPFAGDRFGMDYRDGGELGYYWTGTLVNENKVNAHRMTIDGYGAFENNYPRYIGNSVRAVRPKE